MPITPKERKYLKNKHRPKDVKANGRRITRYSMKLLRDSAPVCAICISCYNMFCV